MKYFLYDIKKFVNIIGKNLYNHNIIYFFNINIKLEYNRCKKKTKIILQILFKINS